MIKEIDYDVIEFINVYKVASTDTLTELFYNNPRTARYRLKSLADKKLVKRSRDSITNQYVYFTKKPAQLRHSLLVTDFYRELHRYTSSVVFFNKEPNINGKKPDAIFGYTINGKECIGILEVEISNKGFDYAKYSDTNFCKKFPFEPKLFIVSSKGNIKTKEIKLKSFVVDTELSKLKYILP